jgi:acetylornithine deacetylase/succinyl-diaminopimelate desuccinylase-like protein
MAEKSYARFIRSGAEVSTNMEEVLALASDVRNLLVRDSVRDAISNVHLLGASSHKVQAVIIREMEEFGFQSEKKGLFANVDVSGIRPDYFKEIPGGGVLFEVERGKTLANNMDLLDV